MFRQVSAGDSASAEAMCPADAARVRVGQRHDLRPAPWCRRCAAPAPGRTASPHPARHPAAADAVRWNAPAGPASSGCSAMTGTPSCSATARAGAGLVGAQDHRARLQIGEVERELVRLVAWIERRRGAGGGHGEEGGRHLRPVRQHDRPPGRRGRCRRHAATPAFPRRSAPGPAHPATAAPVRRSPEGLGRKQRCPGSWHA